MFIQILFGILYSLLGLLLISAIIYLKYSVLNDRKIREQLSALNQMNLPTYEAFTIHNPYAHPSTYCKAQLHVHSTESDGELTPAELVQRYRELGYTFLAITDHDTLTRYMSHESDLILIPGEEMTHPRPFWPLGYHISRLFVEERGLKGNLQRKLDHTQRVGGMIVINHPTFIGNLGTQKWLPDELAKLENYHLMEIANHYTTTDDNILFWHALLKQFGPSRPIWAVGSDDTHLEEDIDVNYIMVQVQEVSPAGLAKALQEGNFYPTEGPTFQIAVIEDRWVRVEPLTQSKISFIDADLQVRQVVTGTLGEYQVVGDEGFVRVEIEELATGKKAWSQPLWILEKVAGEENVTRST